MSGIVVEDGVVVDPESPPHGHSKLKFMVLVCCFVKLKFNTYGQRRLFQHSNKWLGIRNQLDRSW